MKKFSLYIAPAIVAISISITPVSGTEGIRAQVVIDTDMGLDDVRAIFTILADRTAVCAAYISIEGSASLGKGTDNLIGLLEEAGAVDVLVLQGRRYPTHDPPRWRQMANSLGGHPFPPPRHLTALDDSPRQMIDLIELSPEPIIYLALGPLGNLALIEEHEPGILGRLGSIWIPVSISSEGAVAAWNLSYDLPSAASVISTARNVVFVDIERSRTGSDPEEIFASVSGNSPAALWIGEIRSSAETHLMIYDELAALAVIRPSMTALGAERYSLFVDSDGSMRLEADPAGPVRIARFKDPEETADELVRLWESRRSASHTSHSEEQIEPERYIRAFHGHLGPFLVLGYRMGRLALAELESPGHFGLSVVVHSALEPPESCLIDGIQLGSGCTLGKRNIELTAADGPAYATFRNERGDEVTIALQEDIPRLIRRLIEESGVEDAAAELMAMSTEELFRITRPACRPAP